MAIKASGSITLTRVNDGSTGQGVASITAQYYLSDSKTAQSGGSWLDAPPDWVRGKYMWTRNKIVYKNPTDTAYTSPVCDSSWEVANEVVEIANGKNTIYIATSAPPVAGKKVNDIWYDSDDGYRMYNFNGSAWIATQFGTNAITANAITAEKISANAIVSGKILAGAVTTDKLAALNVTAEKIAANAITAGKIAANAITAGNIQANAVTTDKLYTKAVTSVKIDTEELFVGDNAFIRKLKAIDIDAANITTGTISNERINITGLISFEAFDKTLQPIFNVQGNKTYINGGMIATNTIKADKIDLLSGLTVQGANGKPVFSISRVGDTENGTVEIDGLLKSGNFDESTGLGYKLDTDGTAVLNQARISGEVVLPNAGMTNYGAQIGNENLLAQSGDFTSLDKCMFRSNSLGGSVTIDTSTTYNGSNIIKVTGINGVISKNTIEVKGSTEYIYSVTAKATTRIAGGGSTPLHMWLADSLANVGQHLEIITDASHTSIETEWTRVWITFKTPATNNNYYFTPFVYQIGETNTVWIANAKLEVKTDLGVTPWCPRKDEQFNYVRMWAGSNFASRDGAPFRVYQNGDVFAANGTFTGLLRGTLDSGDVQIYNNAVTVHNPGTETEVVNIAANRSVFNSDFVLGENNVTYSKGTKLLNLSETKFKCENEMGTVFIDTQTGQFGGLNILGPSGGQHILRGSNSSTTVGALVMDSEGTTGQKGDFVFTRKNFAEDVKVTVDGELSVKKKISTPSNGLELRFEDDGWGFYAI